MSALPNQESKSLKDHLVTLFFSAFLLGLFQQLFWWQLLGQYCPSFGSKVGAIIFNGLLFGTCFTLVGAVFVGLVSLLPFKLPSQSDKVLVPAAIAVPTLTLLLPKIATLYATKLSSRNRLDLVLEVNAFTTVLLCGSTLVVAHWIAKKLLRLPHTNKFIVPMLLASFSIAAAIWWLSHQSDASALGLQRWLFSIIVLPLCWMVSSRSLRNRRLPNRSALFLFSVCACAMLALGTSPHVKAATAHAGPGKTAVTMLQAISDFDRDGTGTILGGEDCNNFDSSVHPGALEIPYDGVDQNCMGGDPTLPTSPPAQIFSSTKKPRHILLITIDTVRADHFGAYGYSRPTTPNIDRLAKEGLLFENSWAHAPSTRYSIPAILSGVFPLSVPYDHSHRGWPGLMPEATTVAEIAKDAGFTTGAILNYWYFDKSRRMNQGFDFYDNTNAKLHRSVSGKGPAQTKGSSSKEQTDKAIRFLAEHPEESLFLWVHYYDPHYEFQSHKGAPNFGSAPKDRYDQEIWYTDHHIGRLLEELKTLGVYDDSAIIIAGDHGEGFGEHGVDFHGYHLYAAQTRVPMIVKSPDSGSGTVASPVSHVDILPTIADLTLTSAKQTTSDGQSLLTVAKKTNEARTIYQQLSFENNNEQRALASRKCHVIRWLSPTSKIEAYRIDRDKSETTDVSASDCESERKLLDKQIDMEPFTALASKALSSPALISGLSPKASAKNVTLNKVDIPTKGIRNTPFTIDFGFLPKATFHEDWKVFVHFERNARVVFKADHRPPLATTWWKPEFAITYSQTVIPKHRGTFEVWMGLFRGKDRLPLTSADHKVVDNRLYLGTMVVQ